MDNQTKILTSLLNPAFTFPFADKEYQVRKATISQVQQYQLKLEALSVDKTVSSASRDLEMAAYVVFLILNKADSTVTEDYVKENMPGGVDVLSLLGELGFIDPQKVAMVKKVQEGLISGSSSRTLPTEPVGPQTKLETSPSSN